MSRSPLAPAAIAALSELELEILKLLAGGHTAKSIAARIGRTETAVNERLREARRKTGVGSSRELARLLDAQKIWDKNIDLSTPGGATESVARLPDGGRSRSKGTIIMLVALSLAAAAGLVTAAPDSSHRAALSDTAQTTAAEGSPLVGRWSLDVARIPEAERPRRVIIEFAVSPDRKWTTHVEIVAADGATSYANSVAGLDGVSVPVAGNMPFVDSVSLRQPEANTLVMTLGRNGTAVSTRVYTVAADGRSMTETIIWPGEENPRMRATHFDRLD